MDAKTVLAEIESELLAAEAEVDRLRDFRDYLRKKLAVAGVNGRAPTGPAPTERPDESATPEHLTHGEAAERVLREAGQAMRHKAIVERIVGDKLVTSRSSAKHLSNTIYSAMVRDPNKFKRVGRGTWALVAWERRKPRGQVAAE